VYRILVGNPEGRDHLGNLDVDGRIILKLILRKWSRRMSIVIHLARNKDQWRAFVNTVADFLLP
jgi:hypothetical protein